MDLDHLVELYHLLGVVNDRHHKPESIALVEEAFNFVPRTKEPEHLRQRCELDIREEVLALLNDPDRQGLLYEGLILLQRRHGFNSLVQVVTAKLADLERGVLLFDKLEEVGNIGVARHIVDVLDRDGVDQRFV